MQTRRVLGDLDIVGLTIFCALWVSSNVIFWFWWLQPEHIVTWPRMVVASLAIAYDFTFMPLVFFFFLTKMRRPVAVLPMPGLRVAMVTAIVPSAESLEVLERTLAAMSEVRYPHDNWVLDEGGDARVRKLCDRYGASYWTRHGRPEFNQPDWPFQARTKSGNYNAWFSEIAYDNYDYLVQLDTDHAPVPEYLDEVLGYFDDPEVAYVALPSVYWNLDDWTARGSSEQGQVFQGPMQMGYYGWTRTPMIIGSHAAYRLDQLKQIGGFAPSRAEDHLDTLKFAQAGYRGVFVAKNLATGLGPHNLSDYLVQEHQWAFSIAQVLLKYGREKGALSFRQRVVFLFSELWYSWFSLTYLMLFLLPILALLTNTPIVRVPFLEFMLYTIPITLSAMAALAWCYWRGWFKPGTHFFISWRGMLLVMARWPIVVVALFNAIVSVLFKDGAFNYMVTPKGARAIRVRDMLHVALPFIVLGTISLSSTITYILYIAPRSTLPEAAGYVGFALISALLFTMLVGFALRDYVQANRRVGIPAKTIALRSIPLSAVFLALLAGLGAGTGLSYDRAADAMTYWPGVFDEDRDAAANNPAATLAPDSPSLAPTQPAEPTGAPNPTVVPGRVPAVSSWLFDPERSGVTFGAYDPFGELDDLSGLEHVFIAWAEDEYGGVPIADIERSYARGRPVMLSIEPWPVDGMPTETVLTDISAGDYDPIIERAATSVTSFGQPILIRFGHEMDVTGLYPWASGKPDEFVAAYRHVVDVFGRQGVENVLWVWSPAGTQDALDYYPGDDYADYVGTTILEYSGWESAAGYATPRPISMMIEEKYRLLDDLDKPIVLAEVGIALEPDLKSDRLVELIEIVDRYPLVRAIVYFNSRNPENSASPARPDWSLTSQNISVIANAIHGDRWFEQ